MMVRGRRGSLFLTVVVAVAASSCTKSGGDGAGGGAGDGTGSSPPKVSFSSADDAASITAPWRLRNLGKVNSERDTEEGYGDAAAYLERLVKLVPDSADARLNLARALVFAGKPQEARTQVREARRLFGEDVPGAVDYVEGLAEKKLENHEAALAAFVRATEKVPGSLLAWFQRGYTEELLGKNAEAESSYRKVLASKAVHRAALYRLSRVLGALERPEEKKKVLVEFRKLPEDADKETEKCELTEVTLRRGDRASVEPPLAKLAWRDVTAETVGVDAARGVRRVRPLGFNADGARRWILSGAAGARVLVSGSGKSRIEEVIGSAAGETRDALGGDLDNDGNADAVIVRSTGFELMHGQADGSLVRRNEAVLESPGGAPVAVRFFDADHDADLDVIALIRAGDGVTAILLQNDGELGFTALAPFGALVAETGAQLTLTAHDLDQANDLDFVFAGGSGGVQAFLNRRNGVFERVELPALGARTLVLVEDLGDDGAPDVFVAGGAAGGWAVAMNADPLGRPYELRLQSPVVESSPRCGEIRDAVLADIDNDGDVDVMLATKTGLVVLRNVEGGKLVEEDAFALPDGQGAATIVAGDIDGDGLLEALVGTDDGDLVVLASGASPAYFSWTLAPGGRKDNRDGVGTVVEQFSGKLYQNRMVREPGGVHLGLGRTDGRVIEGVRLRWPSGIIQATPENELGVGPDGVSHLVQKEGNIASCPFLYAYGPDGWTFVTDVVGIAPLDEWLPDGAAPHLDPEEFVRIEGDRLAVVDGRLRLAITEELRETTYLDRLQLVAVDHPASRVVHGDASTQQGAYDPLRLHVFERKSLHSVVDVELDDGSDATTVAETTDGRYVHGYKTERTQWGGWVPRYGVAFVLPVDADALLLTGRIAWYDSTVVYALSQNGRGWGPTRLEQRLPGAPTKTLIDDLGVPAGLDRTIVASFGEMLPAGSRLQLSGTHRFLWDQIAVAPRVAVVELTDPIGTRDGETTGELVVRSVFPAKAELKFHGFSQTRGDRALHEHTYDFETAAPDDSYAPATGSATRYGDVTPLLGEHDDRLVVIVAGDRVDVEFVAPPPPPPGQARTWFLRVSGWCKEGSFHNATGGSIAPLPVRAMSRYPVPVGERRDDEEYSAYLREYQTRVVRRRAP